MATIYDKLVLVKIESTKGTDPTPAAATDAVRVKSVSVTLSAGTIDRQVVKATMGNLPHLIGKKTLQAEITLELRGSGAAGTAPEASPLFQSCRLSETVVSSTSVTYAPTSSAESEKSCTIYVYQDGLLWKLIGAVGTMKIDATIDGANTVTFTMQSKYTAPTTTTMATGASFDSSQPVVMSSTDVISDGSTVKVGKFGLDLGNDVQHHFTTGLDEFAVSNRNPSMNFTKDSISTIAEWTALVAGTNAALSAAFGATAGNIATITAPVGKRKSVAIGDRGERHTLDVTYSLYESGSDDQFSIAFT
jgi:hypothetical protein